MKKKQNKGITINSLVVTIVLMLILASVIITAAVNDGIFGYAKKAKDSVEISEEIEKIEVAIIKAKAKDRSGKLTVENLQKELIECEVFKVSNIMIVKMNGNSYEIGENERIELQT